MMHSRMWNINYMWKYEILDVDISSIFPQYVSGAMTIIASPQMFFNSNGGN
jgi:hypothetical protein